MHTKDKKDKNGEVFLIKGSIPINTTKFFIYRNFKFHVCTHQIKLFLYY